MCKKLIFILTLSLLLISSAGAATVNWDFEEGNGHNFDLWSVQAAGLAIDDPTIAGDESLTGAGGAAGIGLPDAGMAWTVGQPNQFDGLAPVIEEGCHVVNGVLEYGPCNDPFGVFDVDPPSYVNSRGQSGYLNTYNLNQWGDNLNAAANDQIATSPIVTLDENAVLTVWSLGGGSGTHAPDYDPDPALMYTDGSAGIAVLSAEGDDMYAILASLHLNGHGTLTEDTLDLSAFAGRKVFIEVVDAFQGSWGWLAIDEIQITNAISKSAAIVVQYQNDELSGGYDQAQVDHLTRLGYDVTIVDQGEIADETFTIDDANQLDLLVISETPSSSGTVALAGTSAPVMHQEAYGWQREWALAASGGAVWQSGSEVDIINDIHPIIVDAGLSIGPMPFFDPANSWTTSPINLIAPGADILAQINVGGEDYAIVFAVEKDAELVNGDPAASRIVGFSLPGLFPSDGGPFDADTMSDEAWAFYDAAVAWLDPPEAPPTAAIVVANTDLAAGFDQAQKDRLESLGYEVTVTTGDDVSGGAFTAADAETFDVLVVSESISSSAANNLIGANVPMMHEESYGWSRHFFTLGLNKVWLNDPNGMMDVVNDTHPIIADAGISAGAVKFFNNPAASWTTDTVASLVPGAENLAQITNSEGEDYTLIFAIEAGTELADASLAANRVVGFSIPGDQPFVAGDMTDDAWALFDAAIAWLDQ